MKSLLISALSGNRPLWLMGQSERLSLLGILLLLKPKLTLEIGANEGGCTKWLCSLSQYVYSVDIENRLSKEISGLPNLSFLNMKSENAFESFRSEGIKFDIAVIDGDHSYEGSKKDLINAVNSSSIIICHDSYNPACRQGYADAVKSVKSDSLYFNPDFVQGTILNNELWGGLALAINDAKNVQFIDKNNNFDFLNSFLTHRNRNKFVLLPKILKRIKRRHGGAFGK